MKLYGNKVTTGTANDIWISSKQKVSLLAAADMGMAEYDCWYDGDSGRYLTEQIETDKNTVKSLALTATKLAEADGVARIGDTVYRSLTNAIAAAQENDEIFLCRNWEENAAVSKSRTFTSINSAAGLHTGKALNPSAFQNQLSLYDLYTTSGGQILSHRQRAGS